jgi:hypothetical protein
MLVGLFAALSPVVFLVLVLAAGIAWFPRGK